MWIPVVVDADLVVRLNLLWALRRPLQVSGRKDTPTDGSVTPATCNVFAVLKSVLTYLKTHHMTTWVQWTCMCVCLLFTPSTSWNFSLKVVVIIVLLSFFSIILVPVMSCLSVYRQYNFCRFILKSTCAYNPVVGAFFKPDLKLYLPDSRLTLSCRMITVHHLLYAHIGRCLFRVVLSSMTAEISSFPLPKFDHFF